MKTHGLTLGKYAPFHKGHELIIETALREMDEVTVIIYDTDVINIPLTVRAGWIKKLYNKVNVIEAWDGPKGESYDKEYEIAEEKYIKSLLGKTKITHFYSSEYYGEHVAKSLNAIDRRIDEKRTSIPISGTLIREYPYKYREFMSDIVYRDLIIKVVFLGAMSTGKSTITEALAKKYNTTFAKEYGRDYWTEHQIERRIGFKEFDNIVKGHIEKEEIAYKNANKYCFVDTNAITTYMFSIDYHKKATKFLEDTAEKNYRRYDLFFLCADDIPYDDTWDRSGNQKRHVFQKQIIDDLLKRRIPFIPLYGSLESRIEKVSKCLESYKQYGNYYGMNIFNNI